ncbi:MAG: cell wall metabolism sensor histidine kinase WalK, partial [Acidobacteria bacterium]|nr:cell wall metabolism sensor histidine kinase WalK [Acidobacteriota bacterium]
TPATRPPAKGDALTADALLKATMNGMREGVLVLDESLRVVASNRAARVVFGDEMSARAGQPLSAVTRHPAIHAAYRAALEQNRDEEVKIELWGAERRFFELRVAPLRLDAAQQGAGRGAIGVFFDITRLERLERVRQEFLSNVSHELRTPLTSILAFVETLEGGAVDDPQDGRRFVSVIRRNAERMHTLIEDILELSAIESGTKPVEPEQLRLNPAVQEALGALSAKAAARGVSLINEVAPDVVVSADPFKTSAPERMSRLRDAPLPRPAPAVGRARTGSHHGVASDHASVTSPPCLAGHSAGVVFTKSL